MSDDDTFVWELPDGKTVKFKPFRKLPLSAFRQIREQQLDDMDALFVLIDVACSAKDIKILDAQPLEALNGLIDAWSGKSKVNLPES